MSKSKPKPEQQKDSAKQPIPEWVQSFADNLNKNVKASLNKAKSKGSK